VKFLLDMPLSPMLAAWLRGQGHDAVHAAELGLNRAPDIEILTRAKQEGQTIVTADLDYPRLLALTQTRDPSLILFRDGNWSDADVIARMGEILQALTAHDLARSIIVVDRDRVRRRRLPIIWHQ
jgi:predicted nuclease of predicted toxin-antitoxin system